MTKKYLRKEILRLRKDIPKEKLKEISSIINRNLVNLYNQKLKDFSIFFLYYPVGSEVDIRDFILFLLKEDKEVYLPKVIDKKNMDFYRIFSFDNLKVGKFNILEPDISKNLKKANIPLTIPEVLVVPSVGINKDFFRLGMGGGYYDRFYSKIKKYNTIKISPIMENFINLDFKEDEFDLQLDILITEKGIYERKK